MALLVEQRELLRRFKAGERRALEEVYRHYAPDVARFLSHGFSFTSRDRFLRFAGYTQPFDLDNALQETFTRAFKESARLGYDGLHPYKNYLLAISRNLVLDEFRNREIAMSPFIDSQAKDEAVQEEGSPAAPGAAPSVERSGPAETDYLKRELGRLYRSFVEGLDERDRRFFCARFEEQRTQVDAGAQVGWSHMQARTAEKKMRVRFLKFMQTNGYLQGYGLETRLAKTV
jgi:RNA polymerase sigma factor (sigma-70 family)